MIENCDCYINLHNVYLFFFYKQNATMTSVAGKKVVYPSGCKEVNEEIGKDELVRRLKVGI